MRFRWMGCFVLVALLAAHLTAPDNAVFDPLDNAWIAENEGVPPNIEVGLDARTVAEGRDPQLERAVEELLRMLGDPQTTVTPPAFSSPSTRPGGGR